MENKIPSNKNFGIVFTIVFLLIGCFPLIWGSSPYISFLAISLGFLLFTILAPERLNILNKIWYKLGVILSNLISPVALLLVFFFAVIPTRLFLMLLGKKLLELKYNNHSTYWKKRKNPPQLFSKQF
jgi:hypothetical protein